MKKWTKLLTVPAAAALLAACGNGGTTEQTTEDPAQDTTQETTEDTTTTEETTPEDPTATEDGEVTDGTTEDAAEDPATEDTAEDTVAVSEETIEVTMINSDEEESGTAVFTETSEGVTLTYDLTGLPEGEFAMHIHEVGQATAPDFEDAGGHWNPTDVEHGVDSETGPHLGDLPNITVDSSGEVSGEETLEDVTLAEEAPEGQYSLHNDGQGTSLIVHEGADDYVSQPTGDAGDRQLAGVIISTEEAAEAEENTN